MSFIDNLQLGDSVRLPLHPPVEEKWKTGKTVYIHPSRRFMMAEFELENGQKLRECYCAYGKLTEGDRE